MSEFISLYSGSSGNCSVVRTGEKYIIIDMGKGVRTTSAALKELGLNISDCAGILVTHEHSDHVKGLATFLKKNPLPVYGADDTLDFLDASGIVPATCELRTLSGGEEDVGDFGVTMFPTSHDVLSNDECSAKLLELIQEGCKKFALCHLSQENNTPALALQTMFNTLGAAGVVPEKDCIVQAQRRNEISPTLTF